MERRAGSENSGTGVECREIPQAFGGEGSMPIPADWKIQLKWLPNGELDFRDPRGICPYCRVPSTFKLRAAVVLPNAQRTANTNLYRFHLVLECNSISCGQTNYVYFTAPDTLQLNGEFFIYPMRGIVPKHPAIPSAIGDDWAEAQKAMQAGAIKAAAVMCRRVLYGVILDKKCKERPLKDGVQQLISEQRLPKMFDEWLPAITDDGHDAAHPHRALEIDPANVAETMEYTAELLRYLYIEPYEFQQRKGRNAPKA